ncbi:hypothetical protein GUJ93_ZPchr0004g38954 [Zizania palustris]|uniref:Uncharacterized protein n=1 Tax=Zizania palustris TaxID=103762 RepID=A0A8J5SQK7_ZIZPA|nr:hypothetical protein GUJ93_ZPchr0004g38954 [Zizania palustris]
MMEPHEDSHVDAELLREPVGRRAPAPERGGGDGRDDHSDADAKLQHGPGGWREQAPAQESGDVALEPGQAGSRGLAPVVVHDDCEESVPASRQHRQRPRSASEPVPGMNHDDHGDVDCSAPEHPQHDDGGEAKGRRPTRGGRRERWTVQPAARMPAASPSPRPLAKKHSKKRKAITVTVDAYLAGASASSSVAPVVAYFPTVYDPMAAAAASRGEPPRSQLFRHTRHPTFLELVVGAPGGGLDFVGRSYVSEAVVPRLSSYALDVLDKASSTLKIVPIAANKVSTEQRPTAPKF